MVRSVAKVFMSGRSLAVRILRSSWFDVPEVFIVRKGDFVVLTPRRARTWSRFFGECACPDFALDRKASQRGQKRDVFNSRYMLDTDIASYVIRGTDNDLNRRIVAHAGCLCMRSITHHELLCGARMKGSPRLEATIAALEDLVPVVEFSSAAADRAAAIRASLDLAGKTIGVMDALIAASTITEGFTLVTNNTSHFSRIGGLALANWRTAK